jgi:gamma-glutamylcyclotransferase (GGCT)/AIG2-like uncharacterized protein YtfP
MRLFLYGTLLDAGTLAMRGGHPDPASRMVQATLPGWQRVAVRGGRYPTLRRDRTGQVTGVLVDVPARAMGRLAAYEGPAYRLTRVVVATPNGKNSALTWIASAGTRRPWKAKGS